MDEEGWIIDDFVDLTKNVTFAENQEDNSQEENEK